MSLEIIIGLEVHLKLNSPNKLFCRCANVQNFDGLDPNTHVCPVCTGQPGALAVLSQEPLEKSVQLGLALWCKVNKVSSFDRKSYFYPDLPMGYQITQQHIPTNVDGEVSFFVDKEFSKAKHVRIRDAHIETDTWKTTQENGMAYLDYNRAATPLVEIVTHPDFRSADEVIWFLQELQRIARYNNFSDAEMEKGQMRCDVNISLREEWSTELRTRVEMKNMSSFSAVRRAIEHEVERQTVVYAAWNDVGQETRGWDDAEHISYMMRSKEDAMDYRYIPDPDLPPVILEQSWIDKQSKYVVESPYTRIVRYTTEYWFNKEYVNGLINDVQINMYFEERIADGCLPKSTATWLVWPIARWMNENEKSITEVAFSPADFTTFLHLQASGDLINQHAKTVIKDMLLTGKAPQTIIDEKWLKPVDAGQVKTWIEEIFAEKPDLLEDLKWGNMKPLGFVTGQVMKRSGWSADPKIVQQELRRMF